MKRRQLKEFKKQKKQAFKTCKRNFPFLFGDKCVFGFEKTTNTAAVQSSLQVAPKLTTT